MSWASEPFAELKRWIPEIELTNIKIYKGELMVEVTIKGVREPVWMRIGKNEQLQIHPPKFS